MDRFHCISHSHDNNPEIHRIVVQTVYLKLNKTEKRYLAQTMVYVCSQYHHGYRGMHGWENGVCNVVKCKTKPKATRVQQGVSGE